MERKLVIIGGGPGGYVAAIAAASLGVDVTVIEKQELGGTCLNRGCIPTKSFYKNAEFLHSITKAESFGVDLDGYRFDMEKVQSRKTQVVHQVRTGVEQLMKGNRIQVIRGTARFTGLRTLAIAMEDGSEIPMTAETILIATGSQSAALTEPGMDSPKVITSDEALQLDYVPKRMVIYGGGVIGVEFAGIFAAFGTEVTMIKYRPRLIRSLDQELSKRLAVYLRKLKVNVEVGVKIKQVKEVESGLEIIAETDQGPKEYHCDLLLAATGRSPNLEGLNLEASGVAYDSHGITVDEDFQTSCPGVFAIGDATGGKMLAHIASEQGKLCVENRFAGTKNRFNANAVPSCIFSFPEIATVGMTEEEAQEQGTEYLVGKSLFAANGKALTLGETDGFIKVIAHQSSHEILGVHIIGPHASDLITEATLLVAQKQTLEDLEQVIHAHPTLAETFWEAAMDAKGKAIHNMPRKG